MSNSLLLAHSPDADDAFMFYALATGKVDTGGLVFEHELQDIESLNERAMRGELDVTAVSIHASAYLDDYVLLPHGFAMGERYGPRIVARDEIETPELAGLRVAVPGRLTSAHLALRLYEPEVQVDYVAFDEIIDYVAEGRADAGVIIHEGQLTYPSADLRLILDLGEWWYEETGLPLPLGANVARRDLGRHTIRTVSRCLRDSIQYALDHRREALDYAQEFARDMEPQLVEDFVGMYVNERTLEPGIDGREAVKEFLGRGYRAGLIDTEREPSVEFFEY